MICDPEFSHLPLCLTSVLLLVKNWIRSWHEIWKYLKRRLTLKNSSYSSFSKDELKCGQWKEEGGVGWFEFKVWYGSGFCYLGGQIPSAGAGTLMDRSQGWIITLHQAQRGGFAAFWSVGREGGRKSSCFNVTKTLWGDCKILWTGGTLIKYNLLGRQ